MRLRLRPSSRRDLLPAPACCVRRTPAATPRLARGALLLAAAALPLACSQAAGSNPSQEGAARSAAGGKDSTRQTLVVVEPLRVGPVRDEVVVSAKVASRTSVQIFPKLSNLPVTAIHVEEGDAAAAGELLLELFDTELQLEEQTAHAALDEARGMLLQKELAVEEVARRIVGAERTAAKATADLERLQGLGDLVNRKEVDDARLTAENASDELHLQRFAEKSSAVTLELARIAVRKAEIEWERAKTYLGYAQVRAPCSGVIAQRAISVGELTNAVAPVFTLVDTDDLVLNLRVPQDALSRVLRGQPVEVRAVTSPDTLFKGVVRTVNPVLDESTGTVHVIVDLGPAAGLAAGLFCEAHIVTGAREQALLVSKRAVLYENARPVLFAVVADDSADPAAGSARKIPFVAGASTATEVEVLSDPAGEPIAADLRVVVVGQENLKDGAPVKVVEEAF